jgi:hypothetical protein
LADFAAGYVGAAGPALGIDDEVTAPGGLFDEFGDDEIGAAEDGWLQVDSLVFSVNLGL